LPVAFAPGEEDPLLEVEVASEFVHAPGDVAGRAE
jgi:hypothetical protein